MIHITCIAHGLHRLAENIRSHFPRVDKLVAKGKQVFLKASSRVLFFNTEAPGVPLPPEPVLTRWGSLIKATSYYCQYFKQVRDIMLHFDSNDAVSIKESQILLNEISMEPNLTVNIVNFIYNIVVLKYFLSKNISLLKLNKLHEYNVSNN
jgi:hypothetical protein